MSYDICLTDSVTEETLKLPYGILKTSCNYKSAVLDGHLTQIPEDDADLSITFNYSEYYYEAVPDEEDNPGGIKRLDGLTGLEAIDFLDNMIQTIRSKYTRDGKWITTRRKVYKYFGEDKKVPVVAFVNRFEGDTSDYWEPTAANAIRPLYQLVVMSKLRPDGVWRVYV